MKIRFTEEQTQNTIDLVKMQQKSYDTIKLFEDDIKWFEHNCRSIFPQNRKIQEASKELIGSVQEQIETIRACAECFRNLNEFFINGSITKQCSQLHLLLWAKAPDCNSYWPAKVLAVNAEEKTVRIQFFGEYSCWLLRTMDEICYLYSDECPEKKRGARTKLYSKALRVSSFLFQFDFF